MSAYADASSDDEIEESDQLDPDASRDEIVRRAFKTSGPVTPHEMAQRLHLTDSEITGALTRLEASGAIFRGHFTSGSAQQWCDRYVLQRIHRDTLAKVRAEVEPCGDHEYAAFLMRWHHIAGADLEDGQGGLAAVLDQLSGLTFTPELWERSILPARVPGYRPELLDLLCLERPIRMGRAAAGGGNSRPSGQSRIRESVRNDFSFQPALRMKSLPRRRSWRFGARSSREARSTSTRWPIAPKFPSAMRSRHCGSSPRAAASRMTASHRCECSPPTPDAARLVDVSDCAWRVASRCGDARAPQVERFGSLVRAGRAQKRIARSTQLIVRARLRCCCFIATASLRAK